MSDDAQDQLGSNLEPQHPLDHDGDGAKGGSLAGEKSTAARGAAKKKAKGMSERTWIILEENEDIPPTGLFVSHNGTPYLIRAGEPVAVPQHILQILDHAVMTMPVTDPTTKRIIGHRERMRYSYRRVAAPEGEE